MTDDRENKLWKQLVTVALQSCYGRIPTQTQVYSCDSSAQTCIIFTLDTIVLDTEVPQASITDCCNMSMLEDVASSCQFEQRQSTLG